MLRRVVQFFSPNLGLNVDVGAQAAKEMEIILEVSEQASLGPLDCFRSACRVTPKKLKKVEKKLKRTN